MSLKARVSTGIAFRSVMVALATLLVFAPLVLATAIATPPGDSDDDGYRHPHSLGKALPGNLDDRDATPLGDNDFSYPWRVGNNFQGNLAEDDADNTLDDLSGLHARDSVLDLMATIRDLTSLSRLVNRNPAEKYCIPVGNWGWQRAYNPAVMLGIQQLAYTRPHELCSVSAKTCSVMTCTADAKIWLCNDNDHSVDPICLDVAIYAANIVNHCTVEAFPGSDFTGGQAFDTAGWNVVVRGADNADDCPPRKRTIVPIDSIQSTKIQVRDPNTHIQVRDPAEQYCLPIAGQNWQYAYNPYIEEGIESLAYSSVRALPGGCSALARDCVYQTCVSGSIIELCNDNDFDITPPCLDVAIYAANIVNKCSFGVFSGGQAFDTGRWNVVVRAVAEGSTDCPIDKRDGVKLEDDIESAQIEARDAAVDSPAMAERDFVQEEDVVESAQVAARDPIVDSPVVDAPVIGSRIAKRDLLNSEDVVRTPQFDSRDVAVESPTNATSLLTRDRGDQFCCPVPGQDWKFAWNPCVEVGINDLVYVIGGICGCPAHFCEMVMCRCGSEIWLCNDNDFYIEPSCLDVAIYAANIVNYCSFGSFSCGQAFDTQHWDVIVRGSCTGCTTCPDHEKRDEGIKQLQTEAREAFDEAGMPERELSIPDPAPTPLNTRNSVPDLDSITERKPSPLDNLSAPLDLS